MDGIGYIDDLCHPGMGADAVLVFGYGGVDVQPGAITVDHRLGWASAQLTSRASSSRSKASSSSR